MQQAIRATPVILRAPSRAPGSTGRSNLPVSTFKSPLSATRGLALRPRTRAANVSSLVVKASADGPSSTAAPGVFVPSIPPSTLPPPKVLEYAISAAVVKSQYTLSKSLVLAFMAGIQVSLGCLLMTTVAGGCAGIAAANPGMYKFVLGAVGLPTALAMISFTGGELFTGNIFVMTVGYLAKKVTVMHCLRNWGMAYLGNCLGTLTMVYLADVAHLTTAQPWSTYSAAIATSKVSASWAAVFIKGAFCNYLVCSATWMAMASQSTAGKLLAMWMPISLLASLSFEHSIANFFLIPQGMMHGANITVSQFITHNLIPSTLGNIFGGAVLMGLAYWYAHGHEQRGTH